MNNLDAQSFDRQIQSLIEDAPQDGTTPELVRAIAPILTALAAQLRHPQYYLVQTLQRDWAILTIRNDAEPGGEGGGAAEAAGEKTLAYAFPTLKDTALGPFPTNDPQLISLPMPVIHILFQMVALEGLDGIVFFETPGNLDVGTEIQRQEVMALIQAQLQTGLGTPEASIPPDLA